jgi:hypothetical protein
VDQYAKIDTFQARLTRRETVNREEQPMEIMLCKFRKNPYSVHFIWIGEEGKGRQLLYVKGQHEDKLHIVLGRGDPTLFGSRMSFPPDSPTVRNRSRYHIREAGMSGVIDRMALSIASAAKPGPKAIRIQYLGQVKRAEFTTVLEAIEERIPPGGDSLLPEGGLRTTFFDAEATSPSFGLPVLLTTFNARGKPEEYYAFDRFMINSKLDDKDFDPNRVLPK